MTEHTSSSPTPILYSFRRCPYAMRARMALSSAGIAVQLREVVLKDKPDTLLNASAKGTVPVLLPEGEENLLSVLEESLDIMHWALSRNDPQGWLAKDPETRAQIDDLIEQNDGPFKAALDGYKYANHSDSSIQLTNRNAAERHIDRLNQLLASCDQTYLLGNHPSLADIALLPFIRQFANVDATWFAQTPYTHIQRWLNKGISQPLFNGVMQKYPPWQPGAQITIFDPSAESPAT